MIVGTRQLTFPYARLRLKPSARNPIEEVYADPELGKEAFTCRLADGGEDSIHLDAVLEYNEDTEHMRALLRHTVRVETAARIERRAGDGA